MGKHDRLQKKFACLMNEVHGGNIPPVVSLLDNFVINESSTTFTEPQLNLLNKGLKHVPPTVSPPLAEIISDIEAGIKFSIPFDKQNVLRREVEKVIQGSRTSHGRQRKLNEDQKILKELREKDVYYMKADKGNSVVILDKEDYIERMTNLIQTGPYSLHPMTMSHTLKQLNRQVTDVVNKCSTILGVSPRSLKITNPKFVWPS